MSMSTVRLKITNIDTLSNTLSVIWASDQSQRPLDEYPTHVVPLSRLPEPSAQVHATLAHLAHMGIQECERQLREESAPFGQLVSQLTQEIGTVTEFPLVSIQPARAP
jgi:hypothetical protein